MIQEDQNQMYSNNNCGEKSSSSKKLKQKKVPQRGLGVAQLEKIRMEEQQKKDCNNFSSSSQLSPTNSPSHHGISLPKFAITNNNQNPSSKSCVPPYSPPSPPPIPMNLSPSNPVFRACSLPNTENFHLGPVPCLSPTNGDGFQVGWPSIPVHGNVNFPKLWHANPHEFSHDHLGENAIFPPSLSLPFETCSVAPLPDVLPRSTLQHQPPSSLVNGLSSSSVLNFPMEPPSNQSFYANYSPFRPDEEKMMVGIKRSCPFPLDNPPIPTFHSKFAPLVTHPPIRSNESTSNGNGGRTTYNLDYSSNNPIFSRDIPPCPITMPAEPANTRKINKSENGNSHTGEFLSLAPTTHTSSFPNSRLKQFCKLDTLPYQVSIEDTVMDSRQAGSSQQPNLLSFFPSTKLQATTSSSSPPASHSSCNSEVGESIDLNLRAMDFLEHRKQQLLGNFEEFEKEFLPPYDPLLESNLNLIKNLSSIEEMENDFVRNQLNTRRFQLSSSNTPILKQLETKVMSPNQTHEISDLPPLTEDLDSESPNQSNGSSNPLSGSLDNMKIANEENRNTKNIVYIELSDTSETNQPTDFSLKNLNTYIKSPTQAHEIAYPPTPPSTLLKELGYELPKQTDTNDQMITGSPSSNLLLTHTENTSTDDLMWFDDLPQLDPAFLAFIDFEIPTSPHMEIDKAAYISKAATDYGEEFAKKVDGNLRILQETMKRTSKCSNTREKLQKGVCCGGRCWRYMESKLRAMQTFPRGRKKKGFELTADQINFQKQRQKIKNRESAAAAYSKGKARIKKLEEQVKELKAENRIRRNLMKFMENASQIPLEKRSLGRTTSGSM